MAFTLISPRRIPRTEIPQGPVPLDLSWPLAQRVLVAATPHFSATPGGVVPLRTQPATIGAAPAGLVSTGGAGSYLRATVPGVALLGRAAGQTGDKRDYTVAFVVSDVANGAWLADRQGGGSSPGVADIQKDGSGNLTVNTGSGSLFSGLAFPSTARVVIISMGTYLDSGTYIKPRAWIDGVGTDGLGSFGSPNQDSYGTITVGDNTFFGSAAFPNDNYFIGKGALAVVFRGNFTDADAREFTQNYARLFEPQLVFEPVYAPVVGDNGTVENSTTSTTTSTPAGTQTYSGAVASASTATTSTTPAGNFGVVGAVAASTSATALSTPAGTASQTGSVANSSTATSSTTPAGTVSVSTILQILQGMADGTWAKVSTNTFADAYPPVGDRTSTGYDNPQVVSGAWSSCNWDPVRRKMMLFGGGHGNYAGNELYLWDAATRAWGRGSLPSQVVAVTVSGSYVFMPVDGPTRPGVATHLNGPPSMHTYDNTSYLSLSDRLIVLGGPAFNWAGLPVKPNGVGGYVGTGPYVWDPSKADPAKVGGNTGSAVNTAVVGGDMWQNRDRISDLFTITIWSGTYGLSLIDGASASTVLSGKDTVFFVGEAAGNQWLMKYTINDISNPAADTMTRLGANGGQAIYGAGSYDSVRGFFVGPAQTGGGVAGYKTDGTNGISLTLSGVTTLAEANLCGIDYDPNTDAHYIADGIGSVWKLAPPATGLITGTWPMSLVTNGAAISAGSKPAHRNVSGVRGKWKYISTYRCFMLVEGDAPVDVWVYRQPGWVGPLEYDGTVPGSTTDTSSSAPLGTVTKNGTVASSATSTSTSTPAGTQGLTGAVASSASDTTSSSPAGSVSTTPLVLNPNYELRARKRRLEIIAMTEITNPAFSSKAPGESVVLSFNFDRLTSAPINPVMAIARHSGAADASPGVLLDGPPQISGTRVLQRIAKDAGVDGTDYVLTSQVDTAAGDRYILAGVLPVRAP